MDQHCPLFCTQHLDSRVDLVVMKVASKGQYLHLGPEIKILYFGPLKPPSNP